MWYRAWKDKKKKKKNERFEGRQTRRTYLNAAGCRWRVMLHLKYQRMLYIVMWTLYDHQPTNQWMLGTFSVCWLETSCRFFFLFSYSSTPAASLLTISYFSFFFFFFKTKYCVKQSIFGLSFETAPHKSSLTFQLAWH